MSILKVGERSGKTYIDGTQTSDGGRWWEKDGEEIYFSPTKVRRPVKAPGWTETKQGLAVGVPCIENPPGCASGGALRAGTLLLSWCINYNQLLCCPAPCPWLLLALSHIWFQLVVISTWIPLCPYPAFWGICFDVSVPPILANTDIGILCDTRRSRKNSKPLLSFPF